MRAIMVAVNYTDLLSITLPYNRHHFEEVYVITDLSTTDCEIGRVCDDSNAKMLTTDLFYDRGATFNKWAALEWGLDQMGRHGWLCIMDADVLWPKDLSISEFEDVQTGPSHWTVLKIGELKLRCGRLCTPRRRMWDGWPRLPFEIRGPIGAYPTWTPPESEWARFPLHRQDKEFAGYSQIFHADDPVLGPPPWHQTDWKHAGGADSFFQAKWPEAKKVRPPFEVLHLGQSGKNWFGRGADPRLTDQVWKRRAERRRQGLDPFQEERLA